MTVIADEAAAQDWLRQTLSVGDGGMARLTALVDLLLDENQRQNLVARGTLPHVWVRHIVDSAQLLHVSRETLPHGDWLDLGTGAGFPGLVIAALEPDRPVTLVDSRRLRTEWLQRAADALNLRNVRVVLSRVEDLPSGQHAVISARAFAPLDKLVTLSARFSTPDTLWLLPKGAGAAQELQMLPESWNHLFHVEHSLTDAHAGIITGRLLGQKAPPAHVFRQRGPK
ncbi:MAG: 16S rRNA (guanine(527)-N(7))-methyltransferase RsmG [Novosphingobium sp. 28-62-57]|uniref:16S rRNA (guanine(527)-N(7))-methyltransferase RsmG n=1 Tax=unclassified Novosphingobium TaxID=2644732 RepID=UPI000BCEEECF|nr:MULTISPECIES: 16S rRNA (guanine(527)-N(7))-methyltransferase RsmG [unclassified Novosphingobium]OYW50256.1 MAG: 16S rRNA (guanine(527)-N(7))-methyltransferase RsmG [Novosphingobium sp. 12-62-10]OYZ11639.1 MAG: 16S rRNA (guanine(527)-N(7))-methyltransferase RsmG [Novosphingobium sp. 28-62-57]OZA36980.1 MAG: 16S rRNA (guanine(527)-N(7))-methyltransferase RsmG [Novosphingobium sp. 17-62-9]HQS68812.1 16S rRNA (guanine(527)-N(7))-methyltransferase RsmG [Novosphingobium sp.]